MSLQGFEADSIHRNHPEIAQCVNFLSDEFWQTIQKIFENFGSKILFELEVVTGLGER